MLIDSSFFTTGPRLIQNATLGTSLNAGSNEVIRYINGFIEHYQKPFLTAMLGESDGEQVDEYLRAKATSDDIEEEQIDSICKRLQESFADYVFFQILRDGSTTATITGLVMLKSANTPVSPIIRQVSIWNDMVRKNRQFKKWISERHGAESCKVSAEMLTMINTLDIL